MKLTDLDIKDILLREDYVSPEDMKRAEEEAKMNRAVLSDYLIEGGFITRDILGQAIAESFEVPYADLNSNQPSSMGVLKIPEEIAQKYRAVFFKENEDEDEVQVTTDDPGAEGLRAAIEDIFPLKKISILYSLPEDIESSFIHYRKTLETRFRKIIETQKKVAPEIIEEILEDALLYRSSDIHFEPQEKEVMVRFRVDGVLHEAGQIPKEYYENILNRIKVDARLRIDEHFAAQDGAIRYAKKGKVVDQRISIIPTLNGEKIVIRLLAEYVRSFTLGDLGLSKIDQEMVLEAARKPFGMILVTGPTGSGKTTTLYALLKILNRMEVNITTIEDPVEYKIVGVNQIQVNRQTNLTFADGLRSIIRQDPNIILVGEIRDKETAEIAVNAALTGHLLLSTFHANDAATAIPRLLDMGVEPFLLASTLEMIIAQRLVRRLCEGCRYSYVEESADFEKLSDEVKYYFPPHIRLYKGRGCNACGGTGYKGRIAIFEFIHATPELQDLMLKNPSTKQLWELARSQGSRSLFEDGVLKVRSGITTLQELLRVSVPPVLSKTHGKRKNKKHSR